MAAGPQSIFMHVLGVDEGEKQWWKGEKRERDTLIILDKIAFHPEGLRSVNILKQSLDSGWRQVSKG